MILPKMANVHEKTVQRAEDLAAAAQKGGRRSGPRRPVHKMTTARRNPLLLEFLRKHGLEPRDVEWHGTDEVIIRTKHV